MKYKYIILLVLLFTACNHSKIDLDYIKQKEWLYDSGYKIGGDYISFYRDIYIIENDTLFLQNNPKAIIRKLNKKRNELTIQSLDGKQEGKYIDTKEFTQ